MRAYERLLHYVTVHTTSDPHSGAHPSAARELDLARLLVEELKELGVDNAFADEHGYVYASQHIFMHSWKQEIRFLPKEWRYTIIIIKIWLILHRRVRSNSLMCRRNVVTMPICIISRYSSYNIIRWNC